MEAKDNLKQIALRIFGTNDGVRPKMPHTGEKIQEAMEISFKAGMKEVKGEIIEAGNKLLTEFPEAAKFWQLLITQSIYGKLSKRRRE